MGGFIKYIKRGIKYILTEHKQPIINASITQVKPNNVFEGKVYFITRR